MRKGKYDNMTKGYRTHCSKKRQRSSRLRRVTKSHRRHRTRSKRRKHHSKRRRPLPAFFLFMADKRPSLRCDYPSWTVVQMAKRLGAMWHQQSTGDKEKYKKKAAQLWSQYHKGKGKGNCTKNQKKKKSGSGFMRDLERLGCC